MHRFRLANLALLAATAAGFALSCAAQTPEAEPSIPYPVKPVASGPTIPYKTKSLPQTLSEKSKSVATDHSIAYRSEEEMNSGDRALAVKRQPAIREAATQAGMEFGPAQWRYRQLECQAVPNHLFLLFESNRGAGDVSRFSVSIPRSGNGKLRIIPVERRGFTLFAPTAVNPLAIAIFNLIRAEEPKGPPADWLATSVCYAALTTSRGEIALTPQAADDANLALSYPPSIEVGEQGESTVRFVNVATASEPMQWALTYDAVSRLVKVEHFPAPLYATTILPKN
jgi:hypothetical protein